MRISIEEFLGECRLQGYSDLKDIYYAILEQDGQLSLFPRVERQPLCAKDAGIYPKEHGLAHPIILDGRINDNHLTMIGKDHRWLHKECRRRGIEIQNVFFMTVDDAGEITIVQKEKKG